MTDPLSVRVNLRQVIDEEDRSVNRDKRRRVDGYSNSRLMTESLTYRDNDQTYGLVNAKAYGANRAISQTRADFAEARQGQWKTVHSPRKACKGNQVFYL